MLDMNSSFSGYLDAHASPDMNEHHGVNNIPVKKTEQKQVKS